MSSSARKSIVEMTERVNVSVGCPQVPGRVPLELQRKNVSVLGQKGCPQVPGRVPLDLQRKNVSVSEGRKVVLKCREEYFWNYRGRMYQCPREERLFSSGGKSTS